MLKILRYGKSLFYAGFLGGILFGLISFAVQSLTLGIDLIRVQDMGIFILIGIIIGLIISYLVSQNRELKAAHLKMERSHSINLTRTVATPIQELKGGSDERLLLENDLLDSQKRLSLHLHNTPLAAISWDKNFNCVEWNPAAERIFGFSKKETVGKHAKDLIIPEEIHDQIDQVFSALLNETGGNHSINENVTKEGSKITCEWFNTPLIGDDGIPFGVSSFAQDITEVKRSENKIKESEEIFRRFYEIIPDVFMTTSLDNGLCVDVNKGFCQTTGYSRDDVIGKHTTGLNLWELEEDRGKLVSGLKKNEIVSNLAANFRRKDGSLWPGIMSACIVQKNGQPYILSSTKDVSDIRSSQLAAIEANRVKSEFLSSMSHELRTPLNAILGFAQLLQHSQREQLTEKQNSSVEMILKGGSHLLELIDQVLELSTIETGHMSLNIGHVKARDVIDQSLNLTQIRADKDGIKIIDQIVRDDLPVLWTDSTRLLQVLLNLLSNAVKYNRKNGTVTLSCQERPEGMLRINVSDTGVGIVNEKQDKLFKPFERLGLETGHIEGTGIGLTITKQIIELLGGHIGFETEVGKGSTFWIDVPTTEEPKKNYSCCVNSDTNPRDEEINR